MGVLLGWNKPVHRYFVRTDVSHNSTSDSFTDLFRLLQPLGVRSQTVESTPTMSSRIDIRSLLNSPGDGAPQYDAVSSFPEDSNRNCRVQSATPGKQKLAKDAPVFAKGTSIVGHVNFPPHEAGDGTDLQARHRQHQIHPLGQIYEHSVRHIPYISDKKLFKEKTGREAFEGKCLEP